MVAVYPTDLVTIVSWPGILLASHRRIPPATAARLSPPWRDLSPPHLLHISWVAAAEAAPTALPRNRTPEPVRTATNSSIRDSGPVWATLRKGKWRNESWERASAAVDCVASVEV